MVTIILMLRGINQALNKYRFILIVIGGGFISACVITPPPRSLITPGMDIPEKTVEEIPQELRGIWVTRFEWMTPHSEGIKENIRQIMQNIAGANFNAVFFQVRGQADVYYPSPYEPWAEAMGGQIPDFDPLQYAIEEAHRLHLQFHAYINLMPLWNKSDDPSDSSHLFFKHGPKVKPESSWVCFEKNGLPMKITEYYYLNPALPQVKAYLKQILTHLVSNYDIDGLHFDRIRYPGRECIYDPYTNFHFPQDSMRQPQSREDWARGKMSELVQDIAASVFSIKPNLLLSCAAWGIYKNNTIQGYDRFSSGFSSYFQDAMEWLNKGWMDFVVPMTYWDIPDPKPNFDELWNDFTQQTPRYSSIFMGIRSHKEWLENGEIMRQIDFLRKNQNQGHVFFSYSDIKDSLQLHYIRNVVFPNPISIPEKLKKTTPDMIYQFQLMDSLDHPLAGLPVRIKNYNLAQTTDQNGWAGIILPEKPDSLTIQTPRSSITMSTLSWRKPYTFSITTSGHTSRSGQWIEWREPHQDTIRQTAVNLLFRTSSADLVKINSDSCKLYRTGIFFNRVTLQPGKNTITAVALTQHQITALYQTDVIYQISEPRDRNPYPLWIDSIGVDPRNSLILTPEDKIHLSFKGSKNQKAIAYLWPDHKKIPLYRINYKDYSLYVADYPLKSLKTNYPYHVRYVLESQEKDHSSPKDYHSPFSISIQEQDKLPLLKTKNLESILLYDLGIVRLGGPIRAELDSGIILQSTGKFGDRYRVRLDNTEFGYIDEKDVETIPGMTARPSYYINSLFVSRDDDYDQIVIPYPEPIPYLVNPYPEQKMICLILYGVKTNSTWLTHHDSLAYIRQVTWEQIQPETYKITIYLKTAKIWGYSIQRKNNNLVLSLKHPPQLRIENDSINPSGLTIGMEAGHGGNNPGAIGLSGLEEKDLNLEMVTRLEELCVQNGLKVIQIRSSDEEMSLTEKRQRIEQDKPDLFISLHANAASTENSYLGANGTSTYYHNPYWYDFARIIYHQLIELPIGHFGMIGSFNYKPIRMTSRPAILIEQAFLSHAEDEEKLSSQEFKHQMAEQILKGIIDYVSFMLDKPVKLQVLHPLPPQEPQPVNSPHLE